jgi:hypothetical protein
MTSPKETFEKLQRELQRENRLQPKERSKKHKELTLHLFHKHGRTAEDHDLWRECHMLEEMIAILDRRYLALNQHKKRQLEFKQLSRDPETALKIHIEYQQEVDEEGRTAEEIDNSMTTRYPNIERRSLEAQAAENYLSKTWGIQRKQATTPPEQGVQAVKESGNPNPILTYKELRKEFGDADYAAVKQAVDRAIADGPTEGGGLPTEKQPWPIKGIAYQYQIVEARTREGRSKPTPSVCRYQKIRLAKEN